MAGEFTHLDPESCIAGEGGRSECRGIWRGSNLRQLFFFLLIGWR